MVRYLLDRKSLWIDLLLLGLSTKPLGSFNPCNPLGLFELRLLANILEKEPWLPNFPGPCIFVIQNQDGSNAQSVNGDTSRTTPEGQLSNDFSAESAASMEVQRAEAILREAAVCTLERKKVELNQFRCLSITHPQGEKQVKF